MPTPDGDGKYTWLTEVHTNQTPGVQKTYFKSKNVVLACGAEQVLPQHVRQKFGLKESAHVFSSDQVLKHDGFETLVKRIKSMSGKCKIYILGGSHSAFSVLYLLLHGPCRIKVFEEYKRRNHKSQVSAHKKTNSLNLSPQAGKGNSGSKIPPGKSRKTQDMLHEVDRKSQSLVQDPAQIHVGPKGFQMNFCQNCHYCP